MKSCPKCQKTYTDENLNFCLEDGTALTAAAAPPAATVVLDQPTMTRVVAAPQTAPTWNPATQASAATPAPKSSKTWLWVVGILIVLVLGCGGLGGVGFIYWASKPDEGPITDRPTSSPTPTRGSSFSSPSPSSTAETETSSFKTGTYTGTVTNMTYKKNGDLTLTITSLESNNVQAHFTASNGLNGSASLSGKIAGDGEIELSGKIEDGRLLNVYMTKTGETVYGGYAISGSGKMEVGNFQVTYKSAN